MLSKKQLAIILSQLKSNPNPDPSLEQYEIPGELAAEIINHALLSGDIKDKTVLDLGCGSGRLTIGSAFMEAKKVIGIDIDKNVLEVAKENVGIAEEFFGQKIKNKIKFIHSDIEHWKGQVDTVIQNPPFGIQKEHADRVFLEKALESGKVIYSLHRSYSKSRMFLTKYIEKYGGKVEKIKKFSFRLPHIFDFHKKPAVSFDVDLYVIRKKN
ncbi:MAG: 50S ribosomal protein L11 methyltransferase [Candidatus Aenigmarchaeota archaeon]|nr:50S ribosomal protein L11 methyltransferase [Candidatus Aenigmarchaeota archaeon]